jgi:tRNA pseudouridine38-40 synthase
MYSYKLTIAYDGTKYSGWQIQPNASSIQEILQNVLKTLLRHQVTLIGSGRTDAGVHAYGQVAHFKHTELLDLNRLQFSLNGLLLRDIRVKQIELVPLDFHAQYSAIAKEYHYHLYLDRVMDPFQRLYCWHVHSRVNVSLLIQATACFLGTHNFTSFANEAHAGSAASDPVRTLYRLDVKQVEGGVTLEFEGDGFLYKMVRNIVGTLVEVASAKRPIEDIPIIFEAKDRRRAGKAAPPQGLFLMRVVYPK